MRHVLPSLCTALLCLAPRLAHAGHGEELLLVDEPGGPTPGSAYLVGDLGRVARDGGSEAGLRLAWGVSERLALHVEGTTGREDGDWRYGGTGVEAEWSFTDPEAEGVQAGITVGHRFAPGDADGSELRLSVAGGDEDAGGSWAVNLFVEREEEENTVGAALGGRWTLQEGMALSLEAESPLQRAEGARLLAAFHYDPSEAWALKFGVGGERGEDGTAALAMLRVYVRVLR